MKKSLIGLLTVAALLVTGCAPTPSSETPSSEIPSSEVPSSEEPSASSSELPSSEEPSSEVPSSSEEPSSEVPPSEEPATTLTIAAALEIDTQPPYTFIYIGEKIRIEDATLTTILGDTAFIQQALGEKVSDLANLEIHVADWGNCEGTRSTVTVEGTLADVDGHAVLEDAVIVEAESNPDAGTYYWPNIDRSKWDGYFNRTFHGYWFSADVQLVSVPTTVVAGTAQTFQVVFPGEDNDASNPDNPFLIDVTIPETISEREAGFINDWLGGAYSVQDPTTGEWIDQQGEPVAAGDYVNIFAMCDYSNYVASMVFNGSSALNTAPAEITNVFSSWEEMDIPSYIVDGEGFDFMEETNAFNYVLDDSSWGQQAIYGDDQTPLFVTAYTYDAEALVEETLAGLTDAGFDINNSYVESDGVILAGNDYGLTMYIWLYTEGYIEFYLFGVSTYFVGDEADALAGWELYNNLYGLTEDEDGHQTALLTLEDTIGAFGVEGVAPYLGQVEYTYRLENEDYETEILFGGLLLAFIPESAEAFNNMVDAYFGIYGGWEYTTMPILSQLGLDDTHVLFNPDTNEFIVDAAAQAGSLGGGLYAVSLLIGTIDAKYVDTYLAADTPSEPSGLFTAMSVLEDIYAAMNVTPIEDENYMEINKNQINGMLSYNGTEDQVEGLFEELVSILPDYLTIKGEATVAPGDCYATFVTPDGSVEVYVNVYFGYGMICVDFIIKAVSTSNATAESVISEFANNLFGDSTAYMLVEPGVYGTAVEFGISSDDVEVWGQALTMLEEKMPEGFTLYNMTETEVQINESTSVPGYAAIYMNADYTIGIQITIFNHPTYGLVANIYVLDLTIM